MSHRSRRRARRPPPPAAPARRGRAWPIAALLLIAGLAVYGVGLSYPFVLDDSLSIVNNASIRDLWSVQVFTPGREAPASGRPLVNLSNAVNFAAGGLDPLGYRLVNLGLHLLCAFVLFATIRRTLELPRLPAAVRSRARQIAAASALLWMVHPLNTEVVEYVTERSESMMALCYFVTLYASLRALEPRRTRRWHTIAIGACAAGMLCKESMATVPLAAWLYDRTFVFGSWRDALRARSRFYAALAGTWLILAAAIWTGPRAYSAGFSTGVSPWTYALNQAVMIRHYLALTFVPRRLVVAYGPVMPISVAAALPAALLVIALLAATAVALVTHPLVGFVGAWLFVSLAPTSSFVPIATEVGAERRMYVALAPLVTLAVSAIAMAAARIAPARDRAVQIAAWAVIAILLAALSERVREYRTPLGLAETVLERRPGPFGHAVVGMHLALAGRHQEAIGQLRQAVPGYPRAYFDLGGELFNSGAIDEALPELQQFVTTLPWLAEAVPARLMIARGLMLHKQWPAAELELRAVLRMAPPGSEQYVTALGFLADTLLASERFEEAATSYRAFVAARPREVAAVINLGVALAQLGRRAEALAAFNRALQLDPGNATALRNITLAREELRGAR